MVGQIEYWVIFLPTIPYIHRIYMVLSNPTYESNTCVVSAHRHDVLLNDMLLQA